MPDVWVFAFCVLAVYRLARLVSQENGPANIFFNIREMVYQKWGFDSWQGEGIKCILCQSVWYAAPAAIIFSNNVVDGIIVWLAISGGATILHEWLNK